jgi:long-chain acyl-CoA synthetase
MNLSLLLHAAATCRPAAWAVTQGAKSWRYGEFSRRVAATAAGLRRLGAQPGDRIGIAMHNSPGALQLMYGCWHAGLCAVPINAKLHAREFAFILDHYGARTCFASPALYPGIRREWGTDDASLLEADPALIERLAQETPMPPHQGRPDDPAWLFYTSGTTGRPKGAMLTHRNLLAMTLSYLVDVDRIAPGDTIVHGAPMSHGSGLYVLPHAARAACQIVPASGGFDEAEIFELFRARRGITLFAAPTMVKRLAEHPAAARSDHPGLKTIVYGGGPMYLADLERAHAAFGHRLAQIYGQGESPMCITALGKRAHADTAHPRYPERLASVGSAQVVVEVMVADESDRPLPAGEVGEVLARGDSVMRGYWRDPEASAATLKGGWLHTGDVGSIDQDGFLTLRDRSKDLIISGGSNIYPREVEEVLLRHPAVAEAAVIGRPDPKWGETVVAFVVKAPGAACDPAALDAHCLAQIARFKRPKDYRFVDALPKNNYGKVLKTALRQMLSAESR